MKNNVKFKKTGSYGEPMVKRARVGMKTLGSYQGGSSTSSPDPAYVKAKAEIVELEEQQKISLLNRFMMSKETSKWQKVQCKLGFHGDGKVRLDWWKTSGHGKITYFKSMSNDCFCTHCGESWEENRAMR